MTSEKAARLILLISLIFAAFIVLSSFFLPDNYSKQAVTFMFISIWLIPFSYLIKLKKKSNKKALTSGEKETLGKK